MRTILVSLLAIFAVIGCARVRVEAPKEPIKMDISMRLDIYQHVQKDIDAIEDIVSGPVKPGDSSMLDLLIPNAYAEDGLSPEVEKAALRRKARLDELYSYEAKGVIGENKDALLELRDRSALGPEVSQLIDAENKDRVIIYNALAQKNSTSASEIKKIYAKRLQENAPSGTPVQSPDGSWQVK